MPGLSCSLSFRCSAMTRDSHAATVCQAWQGWTPRYSHMEDPAQQHPGGTHTCFSTIRRALPAAMSSVSLAQALPGGGGGGTEVTA